MGPLPVVQADTSQLVQVFQNLIGNAVKFTGSAAEIFVKALRRGREWIFSVRDNGLGIDPRYFERIFPTVPEASQQVEVLRHRYRPDHLQEDHREARGKNMGEVTAGPRFDILLYHAGQRRETDMMLQEIALLKRSKFCWSKTAPATSG